MAYEALTTTQYEIFVFGNANSGSTDRGRHKVVEDEVQHGHDEVDVPSRFYVTAFVGASNNILYVHVPDAVDAVETDEWSLPIHELHHDPDFAKTYIQHLLSSHNVASTASEVIAEHVVSFVLGLTQRNANVDFNAILSIYSIRNFIMLGMEKLEKNELEAGRLGDHCTICLGQIFECQNTDVVKIPCGHVYHKPCLLTWLNESNSCPLCRTPLPSEKTP